MPSKGIIVVHNEEDEALKDSVMEHLGVLDTITKLESVTLESINRLGTVALRNKLKGREAVVVLLSAQVLSSKFLRHPTIQTFAADGNLVLLAGRPCAWRIVPWLRDCDIWPENTSLGHLAGVDLDQSMTELTYDLAGRVSDEFEGGYVDDDGSSQQEPRPKKSKKESAPQAPTVELDDKPDLQAEVAAGPATDEIIVARGLDDELTNEFLEFDQTCVSVYPEGAPLADDVLGALLESGLMLGFAWEDREDTDRARQSYLYAGQKLVDLVNRCSTEGQTISSFVRSTRLKMWRLLKEANSSDLGLDDIRTRFEEALAAVPAAHD